MTKGQHDKKSLTTTSERTRCWLSGLSIIHKKTMTNKNTMTKTNTEFDNYITEDEMWALRYVHNPSSFIKSKGIVVLNLNNWGHLKKEEWGQHQYKLFLLTIVEKLDFVNPTLLFSRSESLKPRGGTKTTK